jgi:hypothetical protein
MAARARSTCASGDQEPRPVRPAVIFPPRAISSGPAGDDKRRGWLQNEPAQICVLGEIADVLLDIICVDLDDIAIAIRGGK